MKFDNFEAFEKHIASATPDHLSPLYLLMSKDPFEIRQGLKAFPNSAKSCPANEIINDVNTLSLFGDKRTVLLQDADKLTKPLQEQLKQYFTNPNPAITLVLAAKLIAKNTNFYKEIEKHGVIFEPKVLKAWEVQGELERFVLKKVAALGKKIEPATVAFFVSNATPDKTNLELEIEKLVCYIGDREIISVKDIETLCALVNQDTAWQLGEAIFQRNAPVALKISKALIKDETPFLALIRQIRSQLQTDYQILHLDPSEIQRRFPYLRGNMLQKHQQNARQYGAERFKKGLLKLDSIEFAFKNGSNHPEQLLDILISNLTS
jgi:DNA polymerase-3 subunit delta